MSKELYLDYVKERLGMEVMVEEGKAFIIFQIAKEEIYIQDIFVSPEHRKSGVMAEMEKRIEALAIERGCKYATGTVQLTAKNSTESLSYCLKRGYRLLDLAKDCIILKKELVKE